MKTISPIDELIQQISGDSLYSIKSRLNEQLLNETAQELEDIKTMIRIYKEKEEYFSRKLKELTGNKPFKTNNFIYLYENKRGRIDYTRIPQLKGLNLERYRTESFKAWRLIRIDNFPKLSF